MLLISSAKVKAILQLVTKKDTKTKIHILVY